ncbi:MAG: DUF4325 domain-containing protein [Bacteriovoracaceae bacterium]|nr:DUF4325 domain-containing protein [Bacteriovoracaceae bacterium]
MKINIKKICGEDIISRDAGKKIRDLLLENWSAKCIEISIGKIPIGSASFFDEAFALLLKREAKTIDEIKHKLKFVDICDDDRKLLNYVLMARITEVKMKA